MNLLDLVINSLGIENDKVFLINELGAIQFILKDKVIYSKVDSNWKPIDYNIMNNLLLGKYTIKDSVNKSSIYISHVDAYKAIVSYNGFKNDVINLLFYGLEYMINNTKNKDRKSQIVNGLYNLAMRYNQWR